MSIKSQIQPNDLFIKLHQLQTSLIKSPSKQTINEYKQELVDVFNTGVNDRKKFDDEKETNDNLIEFLAFPILTALKKVNDNATLKEWSDLSELLLNCLHFILEQIKLSNAHLFYDILNSCSFLLSHNKIGDNPTKPQVSEEFYCECFRVIQTLLDKTDVDRVLNKFFLYKNLTSFGLLITVFLDTLCAFNSIQVRVESLKALKSLLRYQTLVNERQDPKVGLIFASFLPGISIKLIQKFLLSQNLKILNHKIVCHSLELVRVLVGHVFSDRYLNEKFLVNAHDSCLCESNEMTPNVKQLIVNRVVNKEWLDNSSEKLFILLERLLDSLIHTDNDRVKMSLVKFCSTLGNECYFSLNKYLPRLLKILVTFSANEKTEIQVEALKGLELMETREINNNNNEVEFNLPKRFSILNTCMDEILLKLPRLMREHHISRDSKGVNEIESHLKTLYGYLKLIGGPDKNLADFFRSNLQNLSHLLQAMISCITFDYKSLNNFYQIEKTQILEASSSSSSSSMPSSTTMSNYSGLKTYLDDQSVFEIISTICEYLGQSNAARIFIDELLTNDLIHLEHRQSQNEIMFLINLILHGVSQQQKQINMSSLVNLVLNSFLNVETSSDLQRPLKVDGQESQIKNRKIIQICLVLETISASSKCLNASEYAQFLIDTLYFALENFLNSNLLIRAVATFTLDRLASNLNYKNIQELLSLNYDYIMNDLILKSNTQNRKQRKNDTDEFHVTSASSSHVFVLCALLEISNSDLVPYLERLIDDYFFSIELNNSDFEIMVGICRIMITMSKSMRKWYPVKLNFVDTAKCTESGSEYNFVNLNFEKISKTKQKDVYSQTFCEVLDTLVKHLNDFKAKVNAMKKSNDDEQESGAKNADEEDDADRLEKELETMTKDQEEKELIPLNIKLQSKCLTMCTHLIAHPFKQIRLYIIELIGELSKNLVEYTNEFLPLVHKLWSTICQRFAYDDLIIKAKIVYLLFDLSVLCGDFISSRFSKEFLPRLCFFMSDQAKVSLKSKGGDLKKGLSVDEEKQNEIDSTYIYSHSFKLQASILSNIDKMCILFEIKEVELENLIDSIILKYLDERQPVKLQLLALNAIKTCSLIDSDVVWLSLHYIIPFGHMENVSNLIYSKNVKLKYSFKIRDVILEDLVELFKSL